jgi:hypothetical protein
MPSYSKKQHNFMEAVAHNPAFAKKAGVPQSVGKDFSEADKGKTFKQGGSMKESKAMEMRQAKQLEKIAKEERDEAKGMARGGKINPQMLAAMMAAKRPPMGAMGAPGMKKGGMAKMEPHEHMKMAHHHLKEAMKSGGAAFAKGGSVPGQYALGEPMKKVPAGGKRPHGEHSIQKTGLTKARMPKMGGRTI